MRYEIRTLDTVEAGRVVAEFAKKCKADFKPLRSHRYIVCKGQDDGSIFGFGIYKYIGNTVYICDMIIRPDLAKSGVDQKILTYLERLVTVNTTAHKLAAIVPETLWPVINLFKNAGFKATKVLRNKFPDCDGYRFEKAVSSPEEQTQCVSSL